MIDVQLIANTLRNKENGRGMEVKFELALSDKTIEQAKEAIEDKIGRSVTVDKSNQGKTLTFKVWGKLGEYVEL